MVNRSLDRGGGLEHPPRARPPSATTASTGLAGRGARGRRAGFALEPDADRPNEAEQLAGDRAGHFAGRLAPHEQALVAVAQPLLPLPGDRLDLRANALLARPQAGTHRRTMAIGPGRFQQHPAQVGIAGNATAADFLA